MTPIGHRMVPGRRLAGVCTVVRFQRRPSGHCKMSEKRKELSKISERVPDKQYPGQIVPRHFCTCGQIVPPRFALSLNKSPDDPSGTGLCFMSQTATGEKRRVLAEVHIASTQIFSFQKPKNIHIYFAFKEQLRMNNMQRTSAIDNFSVVSK